MGTNDDVARWRSLTRSSLRLTTTLARRTGVQTAVGPLDVLLAQAALRRNPTGVGAAVAAVASRAGDAATTADDEPLFVLSAGWRSGSTLLQRLIVSADRYFLWGEPWHRCDTVRRLADSLKPLASGWPPEGYIHDEAAAPDAELADSWIANLYPSIPALLDSHRALLRGLLAPPPSHADWGWGMKEVRLSADYALYLRLLFPRARFVFLVRSPASAWASYKSRPFWYESWPAHQVRTPRAFGRVWSRLAGSFLDRLGELDGLLVRYEDLHEGGPAISRLETMLGSPVDPAVLRSRVGSTRQAPGSRLGALEARILARETGDVARRLGYDGSRLGPDPTMPGRTT